MDRRTFLMLTGTGAAMAATQIAAAPSRGAGGSRAARSLTGPTRAMAGSNASGIATVPLHLVDIGGGQFKFGIEIGLGGGEPKLYTFDTGSSGFYAARNHDWWPSYKRIGGPQISMTYGDEVDFRSKQVRTSISIPTTSGDLEVEANVGQIHDAWGGALGTKPRSTWRKDVAAGTAPLFGHFYGDFGSGLSEVNGLFAILPQLPGILSSGFALRLGCGGSPSSSPTLEIGLTDAIRSEITSWVPMHGGPRSTLFPNSGLPTYSQELLAGHYSLNGGDAVYTFDSNAILDTGDPSTVLHEHGTAIQVPDALLTADRRRLRDDVVFWVTAEGTQPDNGFHLEFPTGDIPGTDLVGVTQSDGAFVNLGLTPYFRNTVVFDVARGLVGFGPCG